MLGLMTRGSSRPCARSRPRTRAAGRGRRPARRDSAPIACGAASIAEHVDQRLGQRRRILRGDQSPVAAVERRARRCRRRGTRRPAGRAPWPRARSAPDPPIATAGPGTTTRRGGIAARGAASVRAYARSPRARPRRCRCSSACSRLPAPTIVSRASGTDRSTSGHASSSTSRRLVALEHADEQRVRVRRATARPGRRGTWSSR